MQNFSEPWTKCRYVLNNEEPKLLQFPLPSYDAVLGHVIGQRKCGKRLAISKDHV